MRKIIMLLTIPILLATNTIQAEIITDIDGMEDEKIEESVDEFESREELNKDIEVQDEEDIEINNNNNKDEKTIEKSNKDSMVMPMSSPTLTLSQTSGGYAKSHSITVTKTNWTGMEFLFTTSSSFPTDSSNWAKMSQDRTLYTPESTGTYYLHLKGKYNGQEQRYTSGAFRVDSTLPNVSISRSTTSWTQSVDLIATATDTHSGVNRLVLKQGNDKNLLSVYEVGFWSGRNRTLSSRKFTFSSDEKYRGGIFIPANKFQHNGEYVLSFKMKKLSGDIRYIGGHNHIASVQDVFIDGVRPSNVESGTNRWNGAVYYPNDTNTHTVEVRFKADIYNNANDKSIHIQPNRGSYDEGRSYRVEIWDIQLENGKQATSYQANSVDVGTTKNPYDYTVTSNGTYTFVVVDKAGNFRQSSITVNNIDRTAPSHISTTISGARSVNGTTYWVRPNDVLTVSNRQYDGHSGNKYGYIRFTGNSQDVRYQHDFEGTETNRTAVGTNYENTSSVQVQSVSRTENSGGYGTLQWKVKLNSSGHSYDIQYYYRDKAANTVGYTTVANVRVDGESPTLNLEKNITEKTHKNIIITATADDTLSGVKRIKLPDGTWISGNTATYEVEMNGIYEFVVEDNVGNTTIKSIEVDNIERILTMTKPNVSKVEGANLNEGDKTIGTDIQPVVVTDWRDTTNSWSLNVSAEPLKLEDGTYSMPLGTMKLKGLIDVVRIEGEGDLPTKVLTEEDLRVIDIDKVEIIRSNNSKGIYELVFPDKALEIYVNEFTAKKGIYQSTINWELVTAP